MGNLGYAYARTGRIDEAQKLLAELQDQAKQANVSPLSFALIYGGLEKLANAAIGSNMRLKNATIWLPTSTAFAFMKPCAPTRATTPCCAKRTVIPWNQQLQIHIANCPCHKQPGNQSGSAMIPVLKSHSRT